MNKKYMNVTLYCVSQEHPNRKNEPWYISEFIATGYVETDKNHGYYIGLFDEADWDDGPEISYGINEDWIGKTVFLKAKNAVKERDLRNSRIRIK